MNYIEEFRKDANRKLKSNIIWVSVVILLILFWFTKEYEISWNILGKFILAWIVSFLCLAYLSLRTLSEEYIIFVARESYDKAYQDHASFSELTRKK